MRVDDVDGGEQLHLREVEGKGVDGGLELFLGVVRDLRGRFEPADMEIAFVLVLRAPAVNLDLDLFCELAAQIFDVDSSSAIDVGWVLTGHQTYAHCILRKTFVCVPDYSEISSSAACFAAICSSWRRQSRSSTKPRELRHSSCTLTKSSRKTRVPSSDSISLRAAVPICFSIVPCLPMRMAFWPVRSQKIAAEIFVSGSFAPAGRFLTLPVSVNSGWGSSNFSMTTAVA